MAVDPDATDKVVYLFRTASAACLREPRALSAIVSGILTIHCGIAFISLLLRSSWMPEAPMHWMQHLGNISCPLQEFGNTSAVIRVLAMVAQHPVARRPTT
ncbi:hypothetical protein OBBRIDRAFT_794334 [Obba rivulosa]|uniref:Uncharacterized protein n=1 Tax=Obba rivulosa TaxID=1052685 RepID=A0A8E2DNB1_9APHY|nr:hypothetical protein OBBRIDRAFT_794334 [Obba rivulosa]